MGRYLPSNPGWYRDPDQPRALRYWDGRSWTELSRPRPPWYIGTDRFEVDGAVDRSCEGPAHPHELREPVASGAWSRDWLPWRPRQADSPWPKAPGAGALRPWHPPRAAPPARLGPARRPLLAMVCLMVVAVAVVVSSVAFITPYDVKRPAPIAVAPAQSKPVNLANRACAATLPDVRRAMLAADDAAALSAAAGELDRLRQRINALSWAAAQQGPVDEWLGTLAELGRDQREYAALLRALGTSRVHPPPTLGPAARSRARAVLLDAAVTASRADRFSANLSLGQACRLRLGQAA